MKRLEKIKLKRQRDGKYLYGFESLMEKNRMARSILSIIKILKEETSIGERELMIV